MDTLKQPGEAKSPEVEKPKPEIPAPQEVPPLVQEEEITEASTPEMVIEEPTDKPEPVGKVISVEPPSSIEQVDVEGEINTVEQAYRLANKIGS